MTLPEGLVVCEDGLVRPTWAATDPVLRDYYDTEWGSPVTSEQGVFERLVLESFQSGLSWSTILKKRDDCTRIGNCSVDLPLISYDARVSLQEWAERQPRA